MIDWGLAERVARFVAGTAPPAAFVGDRLDSVTQDAQTRVVAYTGIVPASAIPAPEAVARDEWVQANLADMRGLMDPLTDRVGQGMGALAGPVRAAGGALVGAEVGAIAGYLAQRVLGQYELSLLDDSSIPRLLFVAPNLEAAARELDADRDELLTWVAFHEVTHAVQFGGVPWLRRHIGDIVRELLDSVDVEVDPARLARLPGLGDLRALVDAVRRDGLVSLVAGPERSEIIDRLQATMALVEGYAEHVMDAVAVEVLPSLADLRKALDRRRETRSTPLRLLERLLGLELKMRQYRLGKAFCDAVVERHGLASLNRAWSSPDALPSLGELDDPDAWVARTRVPIVTK
jgi:coenzyme F420 biosynthesis associated uncharacterized protein